MASEADISIVSQFDVSLEHTPLKQIIVAIKRDDVVKRNVITISMSYKHLTACDMPDGTLCLHCPPEMLEEAVERIAQQYELDKESSVRLKRLLQVLYMKALL
jgi:hypothetical protein